MELGTSTTVVLTGAAGGIGSATAALLAARGCPLALVDVDEQRLAEVVTRSALASVDVSTHVCDIADPNALENLANEVTERHGGVSVLINNAGVTALGPFEDEPVADIEWILDINTRGTVHACRAFLPALRRQPEAHIVNVASMVALLGMPLNATYSMSKGAVRSFSEGLRSELRRSKIGVTAVFPGAINTGILDRAKGSRAEAMRSRQVPERLRQLMLTQPATVGRAIIRGIEHDRARMLVGPDARLLDLSARVLPGRSGLIGRILS